MLKLKLHILKIIKSTPLYHGTYTVIDISWLPLVSIGISVVTIFISFMRTSNVISKEKGKCFGNLAFLSIFIFRMATWQVLVVLLAELALFVVGGIVLVNALVLYSLQRSRIIFEPLSYAVQSLVFPMSRLLTKESEHCEALKLFSTLILVGNLVLISLTFYKQIFHTKVFFCSYNLCLKFFLQKFAKGCLENHSEID